MFTRLLTLVALVGAGLAVPATAASADTGRCVSDNGTNVNAYFRTGDADVIWPNIQGLRPPCVTVTRGNTFYRAHGWIAQVPPGTEVDGNRIEPVYPAGYQPDFRAPMVDFLAKFTAARYVISRDGEVEVTRTVGRPELLLRAKFGRFGDLFVAPDTTLSPGTTIYGAAPEWTTLQPFSSDALAAGEHTIEIYWTLRKRHCDGFASDPANNCLPAGESLTTSTVFTVVG
jgi:hypothetical protein